ncbi:HKD family nuclease [Burkholderia sp. OK233]|nr:HKD family nuclease [Burkholderia sp. OK233]
MEIVLHTSDQRSDLARHYRNAFKDAVELYVVSAYLTEWDVDFKLTPACKRFRFIIGKDFGITRKDACLDVLKWLPASRKVDFLVADEITGFHPKAVIWRNGEGQAFMLIGSSNLSRAAFDGNVEANVIVRVTEKVFEKAKVWIEWIERRSVPVSQDWLNQYVEAPRKPGGISGKRRPARQDKSPVVTFKLPRPSKTADRIRVRRMQLAVYAKRRNGLMRLFRRAASASITGQQFFEELPEHWSMEIGNRLQGKGWERKGKHADFQELSASFVAILDADERDRDDVVRAELDHLGDRGNPARKAFLSEMLCIRFPDEYPVLNDPVHQFLVQNRFTAPRGSSEGARYIDLAKKLRMALRANPGYPAKNLAELDLLIWASSEYNPNA